MVSASRSASAKRWSRAIAPSAGGALEERVVVVPRPQLVDRASEPGRERLVDARASTRRTARAVARSTSSSVANSRSSSSSPVASARAKWSRAPSVVRGLVAQPGELADAVGDLGTDLLRASHAARALGGVVAGAQDLGDRVVVDALAVDLAAEVVEGRLDRGLELDDGAAQVGGHLVGHEARRGARRAGGGAAGRRRRRAPRRVPRAPRRSAAASARNSRRASSASVRRSSASGDDWVFDSHHASASSSSSGCSCASRSATSSARLGGAVGGCVGGSVAGARYVRRRAAAMHGARVAGERFVDHLALERDRRVAAARPPSSYAARSRRARSTSSGDGENARWASATWAGWMQSLPR